MAFSSLLSWQRSFNCCAFWAKAKLVLYQIMLLNTTTLFSQKQHMFDLNSMLATLKSLKCIYSKLMFSWEKEGKAAFYTSHEGMMSEKHDPNSPECIS